jgi:hypothetical protein
VEKVWKNRGIVVDVPTIDFFSSHSKLKLGRVHTVDAPSMVLSLVCRCQETRLLAPFNTFSFRAPTVNLHRFQEVINGREYRIEVSPVGSGRWRAQLARIPGGSVATMPFYGTTPHEAAGQLSRWLSLAHGNPRPQL